MAATFTKLPELAAAEPASDRDNLTARGWLLSAAGAAT